MLKKSLHIKLKSYTDIDVPVESYYTIFCRSLPDLVSKVNLVTSQTFKSLYWKPYPSVWMKQKKP